MDIFLWKKDLTYEKVGKIEGYMIYNTKYDMKNVNNMNYKLLYYIREHQITGNSSLYNDEFDLLEEGDIKSYIIDYIEFNNCGIYLVIQISNYNYKFLCYFVDNIYNRTSYENIKKDEIVYKFKDRIEILKKKEELWTIYKYADLYNIFYKVFLLNEINHNFGI